MLYTSSYGTITPTETKRLIDFVEKKVRSIKSVPAKPERRTAKKGAGGKCKGSARTGK